MSQAIEDPIAYFLEDMTHHGKSDRTREYYGRVLREFESFLQSERDETRALADATHRDCIAWVHSVRASAAASTVATYASYLHRFYAYMTQAGVFEGNPMALVMEELDETIESDPERREISLTAMRSFVAGVTHPLERAVVVTLLKTGMRVGELCNLDRRDLSLSVTRFDPLSPSTSRPELDGRPDSLYVDNAPLRGRTINDEERTASNKRKRATTIPVDDELAAVLEEWLAIRPDPKSSAEPLFLSTSGRWGDRLTPNMVRSIVRSHAREQGWYTDGAGAATNVTPHFFRHYFTTHLRDRTGDRGIVKYLRGDVATDIIDTYTHNWGDRVRDTYERHIYQLL